MIEGLGQEIIDCLRGSDNINVLVFSDLVPPEIQPFWFPREVTEGQLIQISCTAMGDDPITLQWYKDDLPLMSSPKFIINKVDSKLTNLVMRGVTSDHSGKYACAAFSPVGQARYEKELRVKGKVDL